LATQAKRDYYEILGVDRAATQQDIESAFERLTTAFHAEGKPKSIDDVEQLRLLRRACEVLIDSDLRRSYDRTGDDSSCRPEPAHGYDFAAIEGISRKVESDIKATRFRALVYGVISLLRMR